MSSKVPPLSASEGSGLDHGVNYVDQRGAARPTASRTPLSGVGKESQQPDGVSAIGDSRRPPVRIAGEAGAARTGTPGHSGGMRNSNSGRSHGTAGGFANAVPVRTAPTRW